jgi:small GTP-binding protein
LNVYETNIDRFDPIKMNLETLLFQTECIILMWDNYVKNFENIVQLINTIKDCLKHIKDRNIPFILLQNKNDLDLDYGRPSDQDNDNDNHNHNNIDIDKSIEDIKKENPNFIYKKVSLLKKDDLSNILLEIDRNIDRTEVENKNDVIDLVKVDYPINQLKDDNEILNEIKISLLGNSNTGKTSFLNIIKKQSIENMTSTLGLDYTIFYAYIKNKKYKIKIMDTAGQENYRSITSSYIKDKDGFLLFFDVTNKDSYESIDFWMNFINDNNLSKEIILLGNKIDKSDIRDVKKNEVKEYAKNNDIKYIECCCKAHINIYEILNEIILMSFNRFQEKENRNDSFGIGNNNSENGERKCIC